MKEVTFGAFIRRVAPQLTDDQVYLIVSHHNAVCERVAEDAFCNGVSRGEKEGWDRCFYGFERDRKDD